MPSDPLYIDAGSLRHTIEIQAQGTTRDSIGQLNSAWSTVLTTRASIESTASASFRFSFQGNALASNATDLIIIRYPSGVNIVPGYQVVFSSVSSPPSTNSQVYVINAVDDVLRRHRKLALACVGQGIGSNY
jgi:head-tail adaptor